MEKYGSLYEDNMQDGHDRDFCMISEMGGRVGEWLGWCETRWVEQASEGSEKCQKEDKMKGLCC